MSSDPKILAVSRILMSPNACSSHGKLDNTAAVHHMSQQKLIKPKINQKMPVKIYKPYKRVLILSLFWS